jgi:hypothetical protein
MATFPCNREPWEDMFLNENVNYVREIEAELGEMASLKETRAKRGNHMFGVKSVVSPHRAQSETPSRL